MRPPHRTRVSAVLVCGALLAAGTTLAPAAAASPAPSSGTASGTTSGTAAAGVLTPPPGATQATGPGLYVVTLDGRPAASYSGGVTGFRATRPSAAGRFDRTRPAVAAYQHRLRDRQDRVLDSIGNPRVLYRYTTALNGFAAVLSGDQVKRLRETTGVALVEQSTRQVVTRSPGSVPGLDAAWSRAGGPARAGHGVVVGVVDTGIWPENPSFAGLPQRTPGTSPQLPGFHGACAAAEQWTETTCNTKVVSARYFVRGFGEDAVASAEYLSPRDTTGHGSHTASVAAGNHGVRVSIDGRAFGRTSGVAPAARLAVYKACWAGPEPEQDGCTTADAVAAIDRAVADGVDVLAYPVSGSNSPRDSVERAFLNAAAAGVFVAAAAGNTGPAPGGVGHVAPWVTTVAASTHTVYQGAVRLGDGSTRVGAMVSDHPVPRAPLVLGADAAAPGAGREEARRCEIGALDAERVQGTIVVCDRGVTARVDKSAAVDRAGGVGMVLANTRPDSVDADVHAVPTVHLDVPDARAVKAYLAEAGDDAVAALDPEGASDVPVPAVAEFSARGPAGVPVLKPDLAAPGVSILGATAPPSDSGRLWDLASGTSTSAAEVAGLAADALGVRPAWTPARLRSAMMTTAADVAGRPRPFAQGAGVVDPHAFSDPGLVFDAGPVGWGRYLDGRIRGLDLNTPSVATDDLVGSTTVVRRLTNVSGRTETYTASSTGLDGIAVTVRPRTLTLRPSGTRSVRIRLAATASAPVNEFATGALTWTGLTHRVRIPVVVRPADVSAPDQLDGSGERGNVVVRGRSGTGRPVALRSTGLVPADPTGLTLLPGPFDPAGPRQDRDTFATEVPVPAATEVARFEIGSHNAADDVDLYVYRDDRLVDSDTSPGPDAAVTLTEPAAGDYTVYVNAHAAGNGATSTGQLYTWVVGEHAANDLALSARSVGDRPGDEFRFSASWHGLDPTQRWLGVVKYGDSDRRTLLQIN